MEHQDPSPVAGHQQPPSSQLPPQLPTQQVPIPTQLPIHPPTGETITLAPNGAPTSSSSSSAPPTSFPQLSATTEEILKRMNMNPNAVNPATSTAAGGTLAGSPTGNNPAWEAAREQVLKRMVTSADLPSPAPGAGTPKRGRGGRGGGRGRGSPAGAGRRNTEGAAGTGSPAGTTPTSGRGSRGGRGRGRGSRGGRGGRAKRLKREDDDDDDDGDDGESDHDSSGSDTYAALPTQTKSGRSVNRPTQFDPATKTPTRRRGPYRRHAEASVCRICGRGHSPPGNQIVFCDGCNSPYHRFCHSPVIEEEVVREESRAWFCAVCEGAKHGVGLLGVGPGGVGMVEVKDGEGVSGEGLAEDERRTYFSMLPHPALVTLLLRATSQHPTLPIFPPNVKEIINPTVTTTPKETATPQSSTNADNNPTQSTTNPTSNIPPKLDRGDPTTQTYAYPPPGHGLASRLPPESSDMDWLLEDRLGSVEGDVDVDADGELDVDLGPQGNGTGDLGLKYGGFSHSWKGEGKAGGEGGEGGGGGGEGEGEAMQGVVGTGEKEREMC
ncbi:MAG: hypothetical protein M1817_005829 [Caeruleum heppii]|nr:MAG: hypothetical protein M1817_005829 [Caeruleum heppii]